MNKKISPRKILIIIDVMLILVTLGVLIYSINSIIASNKLKTSVTETVIVEEGEVKSIDLISQTDVLTPGTYNISAEWNGPEDIGFVSCLSVYDSSNNLIYFKTGDFVDSQSMSFDLSRGPVLFVIHRVSSQEEFVDYISNFLEDTTVDKEFEGFKDGEWTMNYNFGLNRPFSSSASTLIIISTILGLLIGFLIHLTSKTNDKIFGQYDERQEMVRGKAYRYAFYTLFVYFLVTGILNMIDISLPANTTVINITGVLLALAVLSTISIWDDGYFALNENRKTFTIAFVIILALNGIVSVNNIISNSVIINGKLTYGAINIVVTILFIYLLGLLLVKSKLDDREDK